MCLRCDIALHELHSRRVKGYLARQENGIAVPDSLGIGADCGRSIACLDDFPGHGDSFVWKS
jgi:hypothetical protein